MFSPGMTSGLSAFAKALMLSTGTFWNWATLLRLKSLVMTIPSSSFASLSSLLSTSVISSKSPSYISIWMSLSFCMAFRMSKPRRPRILFIESAESEISCSSCKTKFGTNMVPSMKPVLAMAWTRPSIITLVSSNLYLRKWSPTLRSSTWSFSVSVFRRLRKLRSRRHSSLRVVPTRKPK